MLLASLVFFVSWIVEPLTPSSAAIAWGGILLAGQAFAQGRAALGALAAASVAWEQVREFVGSAATPHERPANVQPSQGSPLRARGLTLRVGERVLVDGCDFDVERGQHILLEGPSGAGKSTLASALAGLRPVEAGMVTCRGFDLAALGSDRWRRHVMLVPQFHENYIFNGTLAMNLLVGRAWPPSPQDVERAMEVCDALGLGGLLAAMPSGLNQHVGDSGWALSHGERNRVFVARALLQDPDITIFDESFSALDPRTLRDVVRVVRERCRASVVIAHP